MRVGGSIVDEAFWLAWAIYVKETVSMPESKKSLKEYLFFNLFNWQFIILSTFCRDKKMLMCITIKN